MRFLILGLHSGYVPTFRVVVVHKKGNGKGKVRGIISEAWDFGRDFYRGLGDGIPGHGRRWIRRGNARSARKGGIGRFGWEGKGNLEKEEKKEGGRR